MDRKFLLRLVIQTGFTGMKSKPFIYENIGKCGLLMANNIPISSM